MWPILALFTEEQAIEWEKKLRVFARTLNMESRFVFDSEYNGSRILGEWLKENGFTRYNHVWWVHR